MTEAGIGRVFFQTFKGGRNFMTPDVQELGEAGEFIYEISSGDVLDPGYPRDRVYGVTVLTKDGKRTNRSLGGFASLEGAKAYAETLGEGE